MSFPFELHDLRASDKDKFEYDFFSFSPGPTFKEDLEKLNADFYDPTLRIFRDERVSDLVAMIVSEVSKEKLYGNELVASIFNQMVIYTLRRFAKIERSTATASDAEIFCQQIMAHIDANVYSLSNLSELSDTFGYNYSYISALFRRVTGGRLLDYYRKKRLEVGRALLNEGNMTVCSVAERLGYSSPFAFSTAFKRMYGEAPKYCKRAHK